MTYLDYYFSFEISFDNQHIEIERQLFTLFDAFHNLGGIIEIVVLAVEFLIGPI